MTRPQPRHCPVCGKQHSDPVTLTCWACITSDVEDDNLVQPLTSQPDIDAMENDPEWAFQDAYDRAHVGLYDWLDSIEPPVDPDDTREMPQLFEDDEND